MSNVNISQLSGGCFLNLCVYLFRAEAGSCCIHVYDGRGSEAMETIERLHSQPVVIIRVSNYSTSTLTERNIESAGRSEDNLDLELPN